MIECPGRLIFIVCPKCRKLAVVCDEMGTVFAEPRDLNKGICGHWRDPSGGHCPDCGSAELNDFEYATLEQVEAAEFTRSQLVDIG
jgi:hypothetical protein